MSRLRSGANLVFGLSVLLSTSLAHGASDEEKVECTTQHAQSQKLRRAGKLLDAKRMLLACARESCPDVIRKECSQWGTEVEAAIPTMVVEVVDRDGQRTSEASVSIDGTLVADRLTGLPMSVDPGDHSLQVKLPSGDTKQATVHLDVGDRARRVAVDFSAPKAGEERTPAEKPARRPEPESPRARAGGPPVATWILGAVGLVALGSFGYFGLTARSQSSDLESCKPNCPRDDAETMRRNALFADISLGAGAVSLALAGYFWASAGGEQSTPAASAALGPRGLSLRVGGRF